jgi:hypothetical protein
MSTNVVYLRMVRGRLHATERAPSRGENEEVAGIEKAYVRLVYCMAAWDDEGVTRGRSLNRTIGYLIAEFFRHGRITVL